MWRFLAARGATRRNAVVLAESQTAYGEGLAASDAGAPGGQARF